ncbi:MAG: hypothetical protein LQ337_005547 [Flavoplaca oasis]|nr:MAG: hypothetical protein LQ337_005547 [Flavoplaca oasis]
MIEFCYTGDYEDKDMANVEVTGKDSITGETSNSTLVNLLDFHGQMYLIGKKYGINSLEQAATTKFRYLSDVVAKSTMWSRVPIKDLVGLVPKIEEAAFMGDKKTYRDLVNAVADKITSNMNLLNDQSLRETFREYPWFASDVRECRRGQRNIYLG